MKLRLSALLALFLPIFAFAEDKLDTGDTAWMMVSTAFVLLMTPAGLALFYTGMTRSKNALNTFAMVMGAFVLAMVVWIIAGYSIAFGTNESAMLQKFFGDCQRFGYRTYEVLYMDGDRSTLGADRLRTYHTHGMGWRRRTSL